MVYVLIHKITVLTEKTADFVKLLQKQECSTKSDFCIHHVYHSCYVSIEVDIKEGLPVNMLGSQLISFHILAISQLQISKGKFLILTYNF